MARSRDSQVEMNFDGLADSVTNLVGALILVLVLVIGITDEAGSQPPPPPPGIDVPPVEPFRGDRPLAALESRVANLRIRLQTSDKDVTHLRSRFGELQEQAKELLDQVQSVQPVDDKDATKPPEPSKVKDVRYRPPFERKTTKDPDIVLVVENNRIGFIDNVDHDKQLKKRLAQNPKFEPGTHLIQAESGDFDLEIFIGPQIGLIRSQVALTGKRKEGHSGESLEELALPSSKLMARLNGLNPAESYLQFTVYPESFETFRTLRDRVWKMRFDVNWSPMSVGESIYFGGGNRGIQ